MDVKMIEAGVLRVQYREYGDADGWPCFMMHGFPYDVHAYAEVAPILANAGARVIVPYMRGYGGTSFLSDKSPRSGEQAAFGADLRALMDALEIDRAVIGGYDWGGEAVALSLLWPERVVALVSGNSYNIQNIARSMEPAPPPRKPRIGISTTSIRNAVGAVSPRTAATSSGIAGPFGRRNGVSTTQSSHRAPMPSTIRISLTWSFIPTGTVTAWYRATPRSRISKRS